MTRAEEIERIIHLKYQLMKNALETCKETLEHEFTEIDKLKAEYGMISHGESHSTFKGCSTAGNRV